MAVRRAAVSASIALCVYLALIVILVALSQTTMRSRRSVCVDSLGRRYSC